MADGWLDEWTDVCIHALRDGWMNLCKPALMDGWICANLH